MGIFNFSSTRKQSSNNSNGNGLVLYQYYHSFYSQKVVFALLEKKLEFRTHFVDIIKGDQYQPWFIKLNPEGTVPVLQDGVKIIPDSKRIIEYLEDNFSNGAPRLLPDKGSEEWQKVKEFTELLDDFPVPELTFGAANFPELCFNSKMTESETNNRKQVAAKTQIMVQEMSKRHPQYKEVYERKLAKLQDLFSKVRVIGNLQQRLLDLEKILDVCESELVSQSHKDKPHWLCSEKFTLADISLTMLLMRMVHLGFYQQFIGTELRPFLNKYFERVKAERASFKRVANPPRVVSEKHLLRHKYLSIALGSTVILGFLTGVIIFYKRVK